ncbi:DMT family transporter [Actomonas aquatica]|uniref:DMT family transporter n=1 Tax=Actomonas aquatica TaxID=2866162 RepID=A0ABZ1CEX1_9BACT|nr:DMT family transporter [Opitutus sp. WL0086]WRQ90048.1 DMT family transporter [Opitutus sp. WL0086]
MTFPLHLLLPLASSFGYVAGVLLLKRSAAFGVGLWRTTFVANVMHAVCIAPFWALGPGPGTGAWWQPLVTALLFFAGQIFTFLAIERGDVSIATPVLGAKIILVAFLSAVFLPDPIPLKWWIAAVLSVAAIALLNRRPRHTDAPTARATNIGGTVAAALGAALTFAASDITVQAWAPLWGVGRYLPIMFGLLALLSFALFPVFSAPLRSIARPARPWLLGGATLLGVQAAGMGIAIGAFGDATAVNIVYSSRGLWAVLAVWWIGHWFKNEEQHLGPATLRLRLWGAALMLAAIGLVLV